MINGQLNMTSAQTVMPLVAQEPTGPVAAKMTDITQDGGNFAGMLSGIQLQAEEKGFAVSVQGEQSQVRIGKDHFVIDAAAGDHEKKDECDDDVSICGEPSDAALQMVMAAYSQPGRMQDVNFPAPLPVDALQKVATVAEQSAVVPVPPVEMPVDHVTADTLPSAPVQSADNLTLKTSAHFSEKLQEHCHSETATLPADGKQPLEGIGAKSTSPVEVRPEHHPHPQPVSSIPPMTNEAPLVALAQPATVQPAAVASPVPATPPQGALSDRMSDVDKPAPLPVDRLQNVARASDQPAPFSPSPEIIRVEQAAVNPVQAAVTVAAITATPSAPDEQIASPGTRTADLSTILAGNTAEITAAITPQPEPPSVNPVAPEPVLSPESELEIFLSQPRPITARAAVAPASTDNRSAALVQDIRGARPRLSPELQIDKVRAGNEQSTVKEMAQSLQTVASAGESTLGSDTSSGSDNNQGEPETTSDNQILAQDMRGQMRAEHQRVSAPSAKAVPTEPARQDVPEQVVHQIKDRFMQHDVKPGNQQITLTLSPDTLGELKMNLNLQGQKLSVEIVTENRTVRDAIILHTDALKESLARQNITMESFDVTTGGKGSGNQGQNQSAWRELAKQQQQQQLWTSPRGNQTAQADVSSGREAYQRQQGHTMLDIHY